MTFFIVASVGGVDFVITCAEYIAEKVKVYWCLEKALRAF